MHWSQRTDLIEAQDGRLTADFEPLFAHEVPGVGDIHPDWLTEVEFSKGALQSMMMAVVEWRTGLAFERARLDEAMPTYGIPYPGAEAPRERVRYHRPRA